MPRKVMLSIDEELLASFDAEVARRGTTRSNLMQEGMRRVLGRNDRREIEARLAQIRAWADEHGGEFESGETIRAERDALGGRDRTR
jgi:metal-responsive CopG/Arc/MetJ family transcriptional regulator